MHDIHASAADAAVAGGDDISERDVRDSRRFLLKVWRGVSRSMSHVCQTAVVLEGHRLQHLHSAVGLAAGYGLLQWFKQFAGTPASLHSTCSTGVCLLETFTYSMQWLRVSAYSAGIGRHAETGR
jgi:hypothetical protein